MKRLLWGTALLCLAVPIRPSQSVAQLRRWPLRSVEKTITVDGRERVYYVFAPLKANRELPLVLVLHGGGGGARKMERNLRFNHLARREGFLVCYPQALHSNWNDGRGVNFIPEQRDNIDDVKYIRAVVNDIVKQHRVDRSRIFVTGASNGGIMSHRLAAEASDVFAAIAPVIGGMSPAVARNFHPKYPVSLFIIQGDADPLVPIEGGFIRFGFGRKRLRGKVIPLKETIAKYLRHNRIAGKPTVTMLKDTDPDDGTTTQATLYPPGAGGVKMQVYLVHNGGHTWPGLPGRLPERLVGKASRDFQATEEIWKFFRSCPPRKQRP